MAQRRPPTQYQQIEAQKPYMGEYSALAEQFLRKKDKPIYSVGQGLVEAGSDIAEAFMLKDAAKRDQRKAEKDFSDSAMAERLAMDQGLARDAKSGALYSAQDFGGVGYQGPATTAEPGTRRLAQSVSVDTQSINPMSAQQRGAEAYNRLAETNPRAAMATGPKEYLDLAEQFAPKQKEYLAPVAATDANGNPIMFRPEKDGPGGATMQGFTPPTQQKKGQWAISAGDGKPRFVSEEDLFNSNGNLLPVPTGMRVTSDGNGGFEITTGGLEPSGITKPTETKLEDTILTGRDALSRMNAIKAKAKPEYQQLSARWANTWAGIKDKAGIQLDPTTKQQLSDFTSYRRDVAANLNQTIKDLTGATVGEAEAPRLMQQIPVAGQGLFDGDGPVEFDSKLKGATDAITSSVARAEYARKNGLDKKQMFAIPLDSIPQLIEQKGNTYADELTRANPQAPPEQIQEMVKTRLREEFGL